MPKVFESKTTSFDRLDKIMNLYLSEHFEEAFKYKLDDKGSAISFVSVEQLIQQQKAGLFDIAEEDPFDSEVLNPNEFKIGSKFDHDFEFDELNQPDINTDYSYLNDINKELADSIFDISQELVPVESGRLKASGSVQEIDNGEYAIYYTVPYAVFVHEVLYNSHALPTQAKFLEDAAFRILDRAQTLHPIKDQDGKLVPNFTFSMEMGTDIGIVLYINSVDEDTFTQWVLDKYYNPLEE